jgi:UPF0288 family protein (methanogenesis marker protein 3)
VPKEEVLNGAVALVNRHVNESGCAGVRIGDSDQAE